VSDYLAIEGHKGFYRRRRSNEIWFRFTLANGKRKWAHAPTLAAAETKRDQLTEDVETGTYKERKPAPFDRYAPAWVKRYRGRRETPIRKVSRPDLERMVRDAVEFFGPIAVAAIDRPLVNAYLIHIAERGKGRAVGKRGERRVVYDPSKPVSRDTLRKHRAALSVLFETANDEGVKDGNPASGATLPPTDAPAPRVHKALSKDEINRILNELPPYWHLFFLVMVFTGMRVSEVLALRWKHINMFGRTIEIVVRRYRLPNIDTDHPDNEAPPKSKYGKRTLGITEKLARKLLEKRNVTEFSDDEDYFYCRPDGLPHSYSGPYIALKKACRAAGVEWAATHSFRHSNATMLYRELGWDDKKVQIHHGHHSPQFTANTYIHLKAEELPPVDDLDALISTEQQSPEDVEPRDLPRAS
jgi:integrase